MKNVYAAVPELRLRKAKGGKAKNTTVTMGAYLKVLQSPDSKGWLKVEAFQKEGFVHQDEVSTEDKFLKMFFVDVGQGDGILIEAPGKRLIVDGGMGKSHMYNFLAGKYRWLVVEKKKPVYFDAVVITHFDEDHYGGLIKMINDRNFRFGTIYHTGIARFHKTKSKRPKNYYQLGRKISCPGRDGKKKKCIVPSFSSIADARKLLAQGGLQETFQTFLEAVDQAAKQKRIKSMKAVTSRTRYLPEFGSKANPAIEVLGPLPYNDNGNVAFPTFSSDSTTVNGHSVVLRLCYGNRKFFLGGDINKSAQNYLLTYFHPEAFESDVAKACHHGDGANPCFMRAVRPYVTIFSSGDQENYSHPRADALGCSGYFSRGEEALVFSTELARSQVKGGKTHYGMINCRCDGDTVALAQMIEQGKADDVWDVYAVK